MARHKKGTDAGMIMLLAIGVIAYGAVEFLTGVKDSVGGAGPLIALLAGAVVLVVWLKSARKKKKIAYLIAKYGNAEIAANIYNHQFWHGQTSEQLLDSLGNPHGIDKKLLRTMKREVWKYNPRGVNRYGLRITLDNDAVSGWDHKQ